MIIIERAKKHFVNYLPFVLYRKPEEKLLKGFFQLDNHLHTFSGQNGFVLQDFNHQVSCCLPNDCSTKDEEIIIDDYLQFSAQNYQLIHENDQSNYFKELVIKAKDYIESKRLKKVVLSRTITVETNQNFDIFKSFENALIKYKDAFVYIFYHPKVGGWMGATPEILLKTEGRNFETMSLAGTKLAHYDSKWTLKEKDEQNIVTNYIINTLKKYSNEINSTEATSKHAGQLLHLNSHITGLLKDNVNMTTLLQALHPTPAVGGLPKNEAVAFINENEDYKRSYYTGFLGDNNVYKSEFYVNLRCLSFASNFIRIYVGCGITKDSEPQKEFEETVNKSKTMLNIL